MITLRRIRAGRVPSRWLLVALAPIGPGDLLALPEEELLQGREVAVERTLAHRTAQSSELRGVQRLKIERALLDDRPVVLVTEDGEAADADALGVVRHGSRTLYTEDLELLRRRAFREPLWAAPTVTDIAWADGVLEVGAVDKKRRKRVKARTRPVAGALVHVFLDRLAVGESRELTLLDGLAGELTAVTLTRRRPREVRRAGQPREVLPFWISGEEEEESLLYLDPEGKLVELTTEGRDDLVEETSAPWDAMRATLAGNHTLVADVSERVRAAWELTRKRWSNPLLGITVRPAKKWVRGESSGTESLSIGDPEERWTLSLRQEPAGEGATLAELADRIAEEYRERYELQEPIGRTGETLDDLETLRLDFHAREHHVVLATHVFLDRGIAYWMEAICKEDFVEEATKEFDKVRKSLELVRRAGADGKR